MSPPPPSGRGIISVFRRTVEHRVSLLLSARPLEEIVYPEELTAVLRLAVAILVVVAYWGSFRRRGLHLDPV